MLLEIPQVERGTEQLIVGARVMLDCQMNRLLHSSSSYGKQRQSRLISDPVKPPDVSVSLTGIDDMLALDCRLYRSNQVSDSGGLFEVLVLSCALHLLLQHVDQFTALSVEEEKALLEHLIVLFAGAFLDTRSQTALHLVEKTGSLSTPEFAICAGSEWKLSVDKFQSRSRPRCRSKGPEDARSLALQSSNQGVPRPVPAGIDTQMQEA